MRVLTALIRTPFSYVLRSPINVDLLKSEEGRAHLRTSMRARFKEEGLLVELQKNYECFRKSSMIVIEVFTSSKHSASRPTM